MNDLPFTDLLPTLTPGERKLLASWLKKRVVEATFQTYHDDHYGDSIYVKTAKTCLGVAIDTLIVGEE